MQNGNDRKQSLLGRLTGGLPSHALTAILAAVVAGSGGAYAAMTVHDPKAEASRLEQLSNAAEQLEQLQDQLKEAQEQVNQLTTLNGVMGEIGGIQAGFDTSALQSAARMGCQGIDTSSFALPDGFQMPDVSSICDAKDFVSEHLGGAESGEDGEMVWKDSKQLRERRAVAYRQAVMQAYAMSLSERDAVQVASSDLAALGAEATATTTQRQDIANLRKIALRQATEMVQVRALLGSINEVLSAQHLQRMGTGMDMSGPAEAASSNSSPFGE